jgi:uncharacterized protein (DUF2235 family)
MSRNIVICCDGTNNQFSYENTNVVRLVQSLRRSSEQLVYYDPGIGTLPEPGLFTRVSQSVSQWWSLAFGTGLKRNVEEGYTYLMDYWEPGDQVYLFGFSRGAYTIRVLAGVLYALGLLPKGSHNLVPYVLRLFGSLKEHASSDEEHGNIWKLFGDFRRTFAREIAGPSYMFPIHFLGAWDTVSSVGWVWNQATYAYTRKNRAIHHVRHAVAIDERRAFFRQNTFQQAEGQTQKEVWFAGVHSDIGGGYDKADGSLWVPPFRWLLDEARAEGLAIDDDRLAHLLDETSAEPWRDPQHESLTFKWWPAEFFPKRIWQGGQRRWHVNLGKPRWIAPQANIHKSALLRVREASYRPKNFSDRFVQSVLNRTDVPETLPFEW